MTAVLEAETLRLVEQAKLDRQKTAKERNQWGQFATPPLPVASKWRATRGTSSSHRKGNFAFLDPAIGTGSFFAAFLQAFPHERIETARGIELDKAFADAASAIWKRQGLASDTRRFHPPAAGTAIQCRSGQSALRSPPPSCRRRQATAERSGGSGDRLAAERFVRPLLLFSPHRPRMAGGRRVGCLADSFGVHGRELRGRGEALPDGTGVALADSSFLARRRAVRRRPGVVGRRRLRESQAGGRRPRFAFLRRHAHASGQLRRCGP